MLPRLPLAPRTNRGVSTRSQANTAQNTTSRITSKTVTAPVADQKENNHSNKVVTTSKATVVVAKQFASSTVSTTVAAVGPATRKRRVLGDTAVEKIKTYAKPVAKSIAKASSIKSKVTTSVAAAEVVETITEKFKPVVKTKKASKKEPEAKKLFSPLALDKIVLHDDGKKRQKTHAEMLPGWTDLDAADTLDISMASEYVVEIFEYMRYLEVETQPNPKYMDGQDELEWNMRSILIDWLVEVHSKFRLLSETLFLAVNLIDRFLSTRQVALAKFQLVGATALFIAAKYEEVFAPSINQFVYIADKGFTNEDIILAERYMLTTLNFDIKFPNPLNFLRRCSKADNYDVQTRTVAKYIMESTLLSEKFISYRPSLIAAAGLFIGRALLDRGNWDINLTHYSGYTGQDLKPVVEKMLKFLSKTQDGKFTSVFKKFGAQRFMKASMFVHNWVMTNAPDEDGEWPLDFDAEKECDENEDEDDE